jgi:hypothetical protein
MPLLGGPIGFVRSEANLDAGLKAVVDEEVVGADDFELLVDFFM